MSALATEIKQKALSTDFDKKIQELQHNIESYIGEQNAIVDQTHEQSVKELRELVKRRMSIEKEMVRTTDELDEAYKKSKYLFKTVIDARLVEGTGLLNELKIIEGTAK